MYAELLNDFEREISKRNPALAQHLAPGFSDAEIRRPLARVGVKAPGIGLVSFFKWHNGTKPLPGFTMLQCSVVPKQIYMLTDLDLLCAHFGDFKEVAEYNPAVSEAVGRFFPVLWDGSTSWLAIDVLAERDEPIVAIEFESDRPSRRAYDSFRELLVDLVRANRENDDLQYFFPQGA